MMRPDLFLFGYFKYSVSENSLNSALKIFLKNRINVKMKDGVFYASVFQAKKIDALFKGSVSYKKSEILGFYGFLHRNRKSYGAMLGIALGIFVFVFSSMLVWDVRIEGCDSELEAEIIREFREAGLSVGSFWQNVDKNKIELEVLSKSKRIAWANINRRGTVAYVTVTLKESHELPEKKQGYSNVVASCDCIIEDITVKRGVAVVKVGDTVKKGDLLISGILPLEMGGGFCYAEGSVKARAFETIEAYCERNVEKKHYEEEKIQLFSINLFGKNINIFKSYRNFNKEYDIIEKRQDFYAYKNRKMPYYFVSEIRRYYTLYTVSLTDEELVESARCKMNSLLSERFSEDTLVAIRTEGSFLNDGYTMTSHVTYIGEVGVDLSFSVLSE